LGEKGNIKGEISKVFFGFGILIVNVYQVTDQFEGIERDADGATKG
jgi:hypothetical protein